MSEGYLTDLIQGILADNGEMSATGITEECQKYRNETQKPIAFGAVCVLLKTRDCFGRNHKTGLWGLRDVGQ